MRNEDGALALEVLHDFGESWMGGHRDAIVDPEIAGKPMLDMVAMYRAVEGRIVQVYVGTPVSGSNEGELALRTKADLVAWVWHFKSSVVYAVSSPKFGAMLAWRAPYDPAIGRVGVAVAIDPKTLAEHAEN